MIPLVMKIWKAQATAKVIEVMRKIKCKCSMICGATD